MSVVLGSFASRLRKGVRWLLGKLVKALVEVPRVRVAWLK